MKNITKQRRTSHMTAILAALLLCLLTVTGFAAKPVPTAHSDEAHYGVGVCVPDGFYGDVVDIVEQAGIQNGLYDTRSYPSNNIGDQISFIHDSLAGYFDIMIIVPIDADAMSSALALAVDAGVIVIVIGDPNPNLPEGIIYITQGNYYDLGVRHADWICQNPQINSNSVIYAFYYDDDWGGDYSNGINARFWQKGITIQCIAVQNVGEAVYSVDEYLKNDSGKIDEIVTYSNGIAQGILDCYYDNGYHDDTSGTGIRAFVLKDDDYHWNEELYDSHVQALAQSIIDTIIAIAEGADPNDFDVIYYGFFPAYAVYVDK